MSSLEKVYDAKYFAGQAEGSYRSATMVLKRVFAQVGTPRTLLDVGCGVGTWLAAAKELDSRIAICGVDHPRESAGEMRVPPEEFVGRDLSKPLDLGRRFDLVLSLEVAEHLDPRYAATFIAGLCRHGDVVLFSAAIPGQGGRHHLNERFPQYWIELFAAQGYTCYDTVRPEIWLLPEIEFWYQQNCLLFAKGTSQRLAGLRSFGGEPLVHPALIRRRAALSLVDRTKPLRRRVLKALGIPPYRNMHLERW